MGTLGRPLSPDAHQSSMGDNLCASASRAHIFARLLATVGLGFASPSVNEFGVPVTTT